MADSIIVGQFVGSSALAAVGACAALTNVFICVALGAGVGAGVLVSRYFGAKNYGKMKTIVSTSLISFLILSVVLGVFGQLVLLVEKLLVLAEHFSEFHGWFLLLSILSPHSVQAACIFFCRSSCLDIGLQHFCRRSDILPGSIPDALLGYFSSSASAGCLRFRFGLAARS